MKAHPRDRSPVFDGHGHMQLQIRDPKGFANLLASVTDGDELPDLSFAIQQEVA